MSADDAPRCRYCAAFRWQADGFRPGEYGHCTVGCRGGTVAPNEDGCDVYVCAFDGIEEAEEE